METGRSAKTLVNYPDLRIVLRTTKPRTAFGVTDGGELVLMSTSEPLAEQGKGRQLKGPQRHGSGTDARVQRHGIIEGGHHVGRV
jgi:hypothetical protein